jgi:hypothetical protein
VDIIEPLHGLRECVVDELLQHGGVDPAHLCTLSLGWREHLWQQSLGARADSDHVVASGVGRSVGRQHEWLLAGQHDGVCWSSVETECSLIEEEDASGGNLL